MVKEGTVLMTMQKPFSMFIHLGIVSKENDEFFVYDMHPENRNEKKGCVCRTPLDRYLKNKELKGIYHTSATTDKIREVVARGMDKKYNSYYANCQEFINLVTDGELGDSDLYGFYTGVISLMAFVGLLGLVGLTVYLFTPRAKLK